MKNRKKFLMIVSGEAHEVCVGMFFFFKITCVYMQAAGYTFGLFVICLRVALKGFFGGS